ncbi:MAG: hypothetical protein CSB55_07935 [Candidatus Cloacimonadota bacterium]|nr:MAG: hypothetical protein CSB55_07935 [Candidatus Cloacimonadota bacterium]
MRRVFFLIVTVIIFWSNLSAKKLGYALSGGGARGFAEIGVLKVLEENGIYPSYIAGTSIGAVIGGFYAAGYSVSEIEEIAMNLNWDDLLKDDVKRKNLALGEKNFYDDSVINLQIKKSGISLPPGLVGGRKFASKLSINLIHVQNIRDFSKLPIPFRCISTDLETGEEYVWTEGLLPQALQASMAIPSIFSPVEVNGKILIDGGICRNFPVQDVWEMGADAVLGIDISSESMSPKDLNSAMRIMNQTINLSGLKSNKEQIKKCTYYMKLPVKDYSILDFKHKRKILEAGETYARKYFAEHPEILEELKKFDSTPESHIKKIKDKIFIGKIKVKGIKIVSDEFIYDRMRLEENHYYSLDEIENAAERIYASKFFQYADFSFVKNGQKYDLIIKVKETSDDNLGIGFVFDSDTGGSLILNSMFLNSFWEGSKAFFGLKLDKTPEFKAGYFAYTGLNPGIGFWASYYGGIQELDIGLSDYVSQYKIHRHKLDLILQGQLSSDISAGLGNSFEYLKSKLNYLQDSEMKGENETTTGSVFVFALADTKDRRYFATSGIDFYAEYREFYYVKSGYDFDDNFGDSNFRKFKSSFELRLPVSGRLSLFSGFAQSVSFNKPTISQHIYLGGFRDYDINDFMKFPGIKLGEIAAKNAAVFKGGLQYEIIKNLFVCTEIDKAFTGIKWENLFKEEREEYFSLKVAAGYLSRFGPVALEAAKAHNYNDLILFLRIGFDW